MIHDSLALRADAKPTISVHHAMSYSLVQKYPSASQAKPRKQRLLLFIINIVHRVQDRQEQQQQQHNNAREIKNITVLHSSQNAYTMNKIVHITMSQWE